MKKETFLTSLLIAFSLGVVADKTKVFTTASDLYARNVSGSTCTRLVNSTFSLTSAFQTGLPIGFSKIVSAGGSTYTLWDNVWCSTGGGWPVAFIP